MSEHIRTVLILIGFWYAGMGWFWLVRRYASASYSAIIVPIIYALFCVATIYTIKPILNYIVQADYTDVTFIALSVVHICALLIYIILNPDHGLRGGQQNMFGQIRYWISKCMELLFQQLILLGLSLIVIDVFGNAYYALDEFTLIFILIHLPLLGILPRFWALYFILASVIGGFLFGALHILYADGLWIALAMHQMFYILTTLMQSKGLIQRQSSTILE